MFVLGDGIAMKDNMEKRRERIADIIDVRTGTDMAGHIFDFFYLFIIIVNLSVSIMLTYENIRIRYEDLLLMIERITVIIFCIDYVLRLWTAKYMYPEVREAHAVRKYIFSFTGVVDLLSFHIFCPYFSHPEQLLSVCCESCVYSGSSGSMPTMIPLN